MEGTEEMSVTMLEKTPNQNYTSDNDNCEERMCPCQTVEWKLMPLTSAEGDFYICQYFCMKFLDTKFGRCYCFCNFVFDDRPIKFTSYLCSIYELRLQASYSC